MFVERCIESVCGEVHGEVFVERCMEGVCGEVCGGYVWRDA